MHAPPSAWDLEDTHREAPAAAASGAGARSSGSRRPPSCPARSTGGSGPAGCREGERSGGEWGEVAVAGTAAERQQGARQKVPIIADNYRGEPRDAGNRRTIPTAAGRGGAGRRGAELRARERCDRPREPAFSRPAARRRPRAAPRADANLPALPNRARRWPPGASLASRPGIAPP